MIMEHSKHELKSRKNILYSLKKIVIEHPYLPITTNSPQRPLSSVSKVTVVEMFGCIPQRGVAGTPVMAASLYVFGKLPSYPSPKPTLTPTSHVGQNVGLGEGQVGSFPETHNDPNGVYGDALPKRAAFFGLRLCKKVGILLAKGDVVLQTRYVEGVPVIKKRYTKGVHNWYSIG